MADKTQRKREPSEWSGVEWGAKLFTASKPLLCDCLKAIIMFNNNDLSKGAVDAFGDKWTDCQKSLGLHMVMFCARLRYATVTA